MTNEQVKAAFEMYKSGWEIEELKSLYKAPAEWWVYFKKMADQHKLPKPWDHTKKDVDTLAKEIGREADRLLFSPACGGLDHCRCMTRYRAEERDGQAILVCPSCGEEITDPEEVQYILEWARRNPE